MQIETNLKRATLTNQNEDNLQGNKPNSVLEIRPWIGIPGTVTLSIIDEGRSSGDRSYLGSIVINISELKEVMKML